MNSHNWSDADRPIAMIAGVRDIGRVPVIIGGGIAGLMTALGLAPMPVVVLAKAPLQTEASSAWAQGGVAAAIGSDDDPSLHFADTMAAGDGLCDADVTQRVTSSAPPPSRRCCVMACGSIGTRPAR